MQTENNDPLSGELSLEVQLDEKGIKAGAKSRFLAALDRLCGSLVDIPGAYAEGISRRNRLRNQIRESLMRAEGDAALELKRADPTVGQEALEHFADDLSRKHTNRETVVVHALEDLSQHKDEAPTPYNNEPLDEDWLNLFSAHSENASSAHLRRMWGKVLSGEIRKPGSFSLSTLRFISELDKDIATKFQKAVQYRLTGGMIVKPDELKGDLLLDLVFLEEVGLLQQVAGIGGLSITNKFDDEGQYIFREGRFLLVAKGPPQQEVRIPVIKITRTGQEIANVLPSAPDQDILRIVSNKISAATSMEMALITGEMGGRTSYTLLERIK